MSTSNPNVIVALDFPSAELAQSLVQRLDPRECAVKVGKELFVSAGPQIVQWLVERQFNVFLDLKFHDIPNTVAHACAAATRLGVWMLNIHASGGRAMMRAARDAVAATANETKRPRPLLLAVTVLTSLTDDELREIGYASGAATEALALAKLTRDCGLDGVVCSAQEAPAVRAACGPAFKLVTPGIRLPGSAKDDQSRIVTPEAAIRAGSDYLVIGRPITHAADPLATLAAINAGLVAAARSAA